MEIKQILDEIANESSTNQKMEILKKYKDNELLKRVLYMACSKRVKFFIKQIPEYQSVNDTKLWSLDHALNMLSSLTERKITGGEAVEYLKNLLSSVSEDDAYIIERIIGKDLKIGMGTSNINKVIPSMVEKTPYMGCVPFDVKKAIKLFEKGVHCVSEIKADGRYCNVIIRGGELEMESRAGEPSFIGDCALTRELSTYDDCVLNGELVMKNLTRLESNGILASIIDYQTKLSTRTEAENLKKEEAFLKEKGMTIDEALALVQLKVWDIIDVESYYLAKSSKVRIDRLNELKLLLNDSENVLIVEHRFVKSYQEAIAHFVEALERGEEGTVLKSLDGVWANGKPTHQIKMKVEFELDLKVVGFNYGNKGTKNEFVISSVSCESSCGKLTARAQGITEDKMKYITENQNSLLGKIAVVKCNGLSSNSSGGNSVFYPSLIEFRDDKIEANSFEECLDIDAGAKGLIKIIKG